MQTKCHLSVLVSKQAEKYGKRRALIYRGFGGTKWKSATWQDFARKVRHVSNAMLNFGIGVQENVGVLRSASGPSPCRSTRRAASSKSSS